MVIRLGDKVNGQFKQLGQRSVLLGDFLKLQVSRVLTISVPYRCSMSMIGLTCMLQFERDFYQEGGSSAYYLTQQSYFGKLINLKQLPVDPIYPAALVYPVVSHQMIDNCLKQLKDSGQIFEKSYKILHYLIVNNPINPSNEPKIHQNPLKDLLQSGSGGGEIQREQVLAEICALVYAQVNANLCLSVESTLGESQNIIQAIQENAQPKDAQYSQAMIHGITSIL